MSACTPSAPDVARRDQPYILGQTPWAVLLCRFRNRPTTLTPVTDYEQRFTSAGAGAANNLPTFFTAVSGNRVDLSGSKVFKGPFVVDHDAEDFAWDQPTAPPAGWHPTIDGGQLADACKQKALDSGVDLSTFWGVVASFSSDTGRAMGAPSLGGLAPTPGVLSHAGYIAAGLASELASQMLHAYGLSDARRDNGAGPGIGSDPWDLSSDTSMGAVYTPTTDAIGPGLNAMNLLQAGWLFDSSGGQPPIGGATYHLPPLYSAVPCTGTGGGGQLGPPNCHSTALELPNGNGDRYSVEFRVPQGIDQAIPRAAVFIHRSDGVRAYLMTGSRGAPDLQPGDFFVDAANTVRVDVLGIDANGAAILLRAPLSYPKLSAVAPARDRLLGLDLHGDIWSRRTTIVGGWEAGCSKISSNGLSGIRQIAAANNVDGRAIVFGLDANLGVWVNQERAARDQWDGWVLLRHTSLAQIAVASNATGQLELFGLTTGGGLVHAHQKSLALGDFSPFEAIGAASGLVQMSVTRSAAGNLHVFAIDGNPGYWHVSQLDPNLPYWGTWEGNFEVNIDHLVAYGTPGGAIELWGLARSSNGQMLRSAAYAPGASSWSTVGGAAGLRSFTVGNDGDGRLEVSALDSHPGVWHVGEQSPGGSFTTWSPDFGANLSTVVTGRSMLDRSEVFGVDATTGAVWHSTQPDPNGSFSQWKPIDVP